MSNNNASISYEYTPMWKMSAKMFFKNKLAVFGLIILISFIAFSALAPQLAFHESDRIDLSNIYAKPSHEHPLGTDDLGRDTFARLLYGGRVSLYVGLISTLISVVIGVVLGAVAGYYGKKADFIIMRIVDIFMCFPFFVLAITMAAIFGQSIWNVMIITGVLSWTSICRIVRAEVMALKEREFVEAANALGVTNVEIIFKHILPNILAVIIVYATLGIANGILSEAGLSYLGLGVKQPQPSWGNMLAAAQNLQTLQSRWWLWIPPGMAVFLTILSINFVGDGLRDALDPKLKR